MPQFTANPNDILAKFFRPEILTHPHIPGDLAGVNPRTIMGKEWWDIMRRAAYAENNGHCWACGIVSSKDPFKDWLEAHERYTFDYKEGTMTFEEVVALCHSCHCFIHSGRLWAMYQDKASSVPRRKVAYVINTRLAILHVHVPPLKPFLYTQAIAYMLKGSSEVRAIGKAWVMDKLPWNRGPHYPKRWKMVFDNRAYYSLTEHEPFPAKEAKHGPETRTD